MDSKEYFITRRDFRIDPESQIEFTLLHGPSVLVLSDLDCELSKSLFFSATRSKHSSTMPMALSFKMIGGSAAERRLRMRSVETSLSER